MVALNIADVEACDNDTWRITSRRMVRDAEVRAAETARKNAGKSPEVIRKNSGTLAGARPRPGTGTGTEEGTVVEDGKDKVSSEPAPGWDAFWAIYPRNVAKTVALVAWNKLAPNLETRNAILGNIHIRLESGEWKTDKASAKYIPHPATYLRGERWTDEPPTPAEEPCPFGPMRLAE